MDDGGSMFTTTIVDKMFLGMANGVDVMAEMWGRV